MGVLRKSLFLLLALHNAAYVHSQTGVQPFLNAFCKANANNKGCHSKPLLTEGGAGGSTPGLDQGSNVACLVGTKRCTQLPNLCVPSDIPCSAIDAAYVYSQTDVQTFLNAFCRANADNKGCHSKPLVTGGGAGGSTPGLDQGSNVACLAGTKRCTQLPNLCVPSDIPCSAIDAAYVHSQTDVQTFLNAFCRANADNKGCHSKPLVTEGGAGGSTPGLDQGSNVACLAGTKRCTQLPNLCVPSDIPCSAIDAAYVHSQTDVQTFLNAFCKANANNKGCHSKPLVTEGGAGGSTPGLDQGSNVACLAGTKRCTQLPNLCVPSDIPCSVIDAAYVHSQTDVQTFLNAFCRANAYIKGCHSKPLVTEGVAGGSIPRLDQGSNVACLPGTKRCTQLPNMCVPSDIPCSAIGSDRFCEQPKAINTKQRVLVCGDGSTVCSTASKLPLLTVLIVQCLGNYDIVAQQSGVEHQLQSLGVMEKTGSNKGAGIYMCDTSLSWRPLAGSPPLDALQPSCLDAGCGYIPEPIQDIAVDRRWSWVRLLYRNDQPACSLTLVANHAAITAAHCVTKNPASREIPNIGEFSIEMPGYTVEPKNIFIHPQYDPNSRYAHDLAVITFSPHSDNILPTVCIADEAVIPSRDREQVIFVLDENRKTPEWFTRPSKWSTNCLGLSPSNTFCRDQLDLKESQFCAQYEAIGITSGSSGGPYLADIGTGVDEVWVIMGVLSTVNNSSSCSQGHLVYSNVANDAQWLKECVFYDRCNALSTIIQGR
ncbi:uncharacterized protein LOC125029126 isoform X2 [Penaeus chinensis]|uniref:uncharacterized protein LOC125029126 isoform X2 n=1 Tax=Penaeus chinensis TaxID=139456 RepID=UPI001FB68BFC|nr:uncharacterized protein LOC125029126 isoform X2 [Penaeus chinensis]